MNNLSFTITQGKFFTVVYRLPANQLYRSEIKQHFGVK
jgi:hypothetical protein